MQTNLRILMRGIAGLLVLAVGMRLVHEVQASRTLDPLLIPVPYFHPNYNSQTEPAHKEDAWKLYGLWLARNKRDVSADMLKFLQHDYRDLRDSAASMLGRIESPSAKAPLEKALAEAEQGTATKFINPVVLKLALGRIKSRGLSGQTKVEAVAKSMGLSWSQVGELSTKLRFSHSNMNGSDGEKLVEEVVDTLYVMGKKGENITPLTKTLSLYPPQKTLLQGAALPPDQEAKFLVAYLSGIPAVTRSDKQLAERYLMDLGPHASEAILQWMVQLKKHPVLHSNSRTGGYVNQIFGVATLLGDQRTLPLLEHFANTGKPPFKGIAQHRLREFGIMKNSRVRRAAWSRWPPVTRY